MNPGGQGGEYSVTILGGTGIASRLYISADEHSPLMEGRALLLWDPTSITSMNELAM